MRLVHGNGSLAHANEPDLALIRLLAKARTWWSLIASGSTAPGKLARVEGVSVSWLLRVLRLALLSPTVTTAIFDGKLKAGIDATTLLAIDGIALDWQAQE